MSFWHPGKNFMTFCRPFLSFGRQKFIKRTEKSLAAFFCAPIWSATKKRQQKVAEVILVGKRSSWWKGRQKVVALHLTGFTAFYSTEFKDGYFYILCLKAVVFLLPPFLWIVASFCLHALVKEIFTHLMYIIYYVQARILVNSINWIYLSIVKEIILDRLIDYTLYTIPM